jgi:alkanesulfonate monooxygenase SsuD/methylene tetrahydromethanopterin reductase-like flavin-dependent oxidoreductase (luciferase family)
MGRRLKGWDSLGHVGAKRGIFLPPFDELVEPRTLAELAAQAEESGWDGFFLWDQITYRPPTEAVADPWIALSAIACSTEKLRIGPLVTPLARRRVQKVARETVTLDHLSQGRLTLGVGLGGDDNGEFEPFGDPGDPKERARILDQGLEQLSDYWAGEFKPLPVQQPRIPVWVAGRWPNRRPLRRATRWDGFFPIDLTGPDDLATFATELAELRTGDDTPFDLIAEMDPGDDPGPWESAGATWVLTSFDVLPEVGAVREAIASGLG